MRGNGADALNSIALDGLAPPVFNQIALERLSGQVPDTIPLMRGAPDVDTDLGQVSIDLTPHEREYPAMLGERQTVETVRGVMDAYSGMPQGYDIALTPGGRPALDAVVTLFSRDTVFLVPELAYSAVPSILQLRGRQSVTAPVDLVGFDIDSYLDGILAKVGELQAQGYQHIVLLETIPGNPLGIAYPENRRADFLNQLQERGVYVVMDSFYSTYTDPSSDNYPNNPFRGLADMERRLLVSGLTKEGPFPNPGLRAAWIAGDPKLIRGLSTIFSSIMGGVSSAVQKILKGILGGALNPDGTINDNYMRLMKQFSASRIDNKVTMIRRLQQMGFSVFGQDGTGLSQHGMYVMARVPQGTPDLVSGFGQWCEVGTPPGLPLNSFVADPKLRAPASLYRSGVPDGENWPYADIARICTGARMRFLGQAADSLAVGVETLRRRNESRGKSELERAPIIQ